MITIEEYLLEVYKDFKEYVKNTDTENLCLLKRLNYQAGQVPDYTDVHIQQYYLLRYAFSYAFEYKQMFLEVLEKTTYEDEILLTSIGCGNMIDYWSLVEALSKFVSRKVSVKYTGIDLIDWNYKIEPRSRDNVKFKQGNASEILCESDSLSSDMYIFPKSISEFSDAEFKKICDVFRDRTFLKDTIYVLISLRTNDGSMDRDMDRSDEIISALTKSGFKTKDKARRYTHFQDEDKGIKALDCAFDYPDEAIKLLKSLYRECNKYEECNDNCKTYLNRWPILKLKNVRYQILTFYRED